MEKYLKWVSMGALFAVLFVPLYISSSLFFPFITGKAFLFRILIEIGVGAWATLALINPAYRPRKNPLFWALTVFVLITLLADITGVYFAKSFWSNFERMEGFVTILHLYAYFVAITSIFKTDGLWNRFLNTSLVASLIVGFRGFFQLFGLYASTQSGSRLDGTFGNASYFAVYMLFNIFIALYLLSRNWDSKWRRVAYILIVLFESFLLLFSATRGSILGLAGGLFLTLAVIAWFERENKKLRKIAVWSIVALVAVAGLFFIFRKTTVVESIEPLKRVASISLEDRTTQSRFLVWDMALQGFKERPLLGWGQGNFMFIFEKYYNPEMWNQEPWFDRAHNIIFDWLSAGGALGLLSYLSLFAAAIWLIWKRSDFSVAETGIMTGLLAAYSFHNLFVFDNIGSYIMFFSILGFVARKSLSPEDEEALSDRAPSGASSFAYAKALAPFAVALALFSIYFFNVKGILASNSLLRALRTYEEGPTKNLEHFKKALSYGTYADQEIVEQLMGAASAVVGSDAVSGELKQDFVTLANLEMRRLIREAPSSARRNLFLGSFLNRLGFYDEALSYLERSLELSPKKQPIFFEFASNYLRTEDYGKAVEFSKTAYELDKDFDEARIIYATALIYDGKADSADEVLKEKFGEDMYPDERLIKAYFDTGALDKVIESRERLVELSPGNFQNRVSLAATYLQTGRRVESIRVLKEAIEANPDFKEQGEFFIQEIEAGRNP